MSRARLEEIRDGHTRDAQALRQDAARFRQQAEVAEINAHRAEAAAFGVNETIAELFPGETPQNGTVTNFPGTAVETGPESHAESAG